MKHALRPDQHAHSVGLDVHLGGRWASSGWLSMVGGKMNTVEYQAGIDATPDGEYALRILSRYRQACDCRWSDSSEGPSNTPLMVVLNELEEKRAAELDRAIAVLELFVQLSRPNTYIYCRGNRSRKMKYLIEHLDDGNVRLENEMDSEDTMRFSRDKAQAIHEALAVVCAGDCACYQAEREEGTNMMPEESPLSFQLDEATKYYSGFISYTTPAYREMAQKALAGKLPYTFSLPCGHVVRWDTLDDIPKETTPCPCGNENHWIIFYQSQEENDGWIREGCLTAPS